MRATNKPPTRPLPPNIVVPRIYRRHPVVFAVLVLLAAGAVVDRVCGRRQSDDYTRYHNHIFTVVKVVDGDTFDIDLPDSEHDTTRIRLWGVDTPEVAGSRSGAMHFGPEASAFAKRALAGQLVRIELSPTKTRGLYGRLLAYAHLVPHGESFNELLIEHGWAYADWRFPHPLKRRYKDLEKRARRQGVGLWAEVELKLMPPWRQRMEQAFEEE
ncbi:MAG: hypothetical protein GY842_08540 [bacterium]|nr:hypothetical protein [bacterium]